MYVSQKEHDNYIYCDFCEQLNLYSSYQTKLPRSSHASPSAKIVNQKMHAERISYL